MTDARRRATLAVLLVAMLGALLVSLPSPSADAEELSVHAVTPLVDVIASIPSIPSTQTSIAAPTSTTARTADEPAVTDETTTTSAPDATTTTEVAAERVAETTSTTEPAPPPPPPSPPTTEAPPTPTTTEAPPPPPPSGSPSSIIREIFGAHGEAALIIARCESSLNPSATNPAGYYGLFQIGSAHASRFESVTGTSWSTGRYDAWANTTYAKWLFDSSGQTWSQWGCRHQL